MARARLQSTSRRVSAPWVLVLGAGVSLAHVSIVGAAEPPRVETQSPKAEEPPAGPELLRQAEAAYEGILIGQARTLAQRALSAGSMSVDETRRAYRLIGDSYAIEREPDKARQAYTRLLAIDPRAEPNDELNPQMQSSFFEARNFWNQRGGELGLDAELRDRDGVPTLTIEIRDPLPMAHEVLVRRIVDGDEVEQRLPATSSPARLELPAGTTSVELFAVLVDRSDNELFRLGSREAPRTVTLPTTRAPAPAVEKKAPSPGAAEPMPTQRDRGRVARSKWLWIGLALGIAAIAGGVTAIALTRDRGAEIPVSVNVPR